MDRVLDKINRIYFRQDCRINTIKSIFRKYIQAFVIAGVCLFICGCQSETTGPVQEVLSQGKASIDEAVETLMLQQQNVQPLRAFADCVFHYKDAEGKNKQQKVERVTVRFIPPDNILFRGIEFGEVGFGANENEFWVRIKPEWDSYWWGTRDQIEWCTEVMFINPYNVTEALGVVEVTTEWRLSHKNGYDILSLFNDKTLEKRIFVDVDDYRINRIEYFDPKGYLKAAADLGRYKRIQNSVYIPVSIAISTYNRGIEEFRVEMELQHTGIFKPTEKQMLKLFQRPGRDGFEYVYRLDENCEFEQVQE